MSKFTDEIGIAILEVMKDPVFIQRLKYNTNGKIFWTYKTSDPGYVEFAKHHPNYSDGTPAVYTTIAAGYAAMTSNQNDVLLINANAEYSEAMLTVDKNRCHFIGMDGGGRKNSQGARFATPATSVVASVAVLKNTGTRNTYRNIKFIQQGTNAAQTSGVIDAGEGTYMENCEMEVNGLLTTVTQGLLFAGDTCHYKSCQIGNSTVYHNVSAQAPLTIKKYSGAYARYSYFEDCTIIQYTSKTDSPCVQTTEADGFIGWISFQNCDFINARKGDGATAGGAMAAAVVTATTSGYLLLDNRCTSYGATAMIEADAYILNAGTVGDTAAAGGTAVAGA